MNNLKLIPMWAWGVLLALGLGVGFWLGGNNNNCSECSCDAGCCDSGVCAVEDCSCSCKK